MNDKSDKYEPVTLGDIYEKINAKIDDVAAHVVAAFIIFILSEHQRIRDGTIAVGIIAIIIRVWFGPELDIIEIILISTLILMLIILSKPSVSKVVKKLSRIVVYRRNITGEEDKE